MTDDEFDGLNDIVAYGEFGGYRYCATGEQVDHSDIYVIDAQGVKFFKRKYRGTKIPVVVYLKVPAVQRFKRLIKRDGLRKGLRRWLNDIPHFWKAKEFSDYVVTNSGGHIFSSICVIDNILKSDNIREIDGLVKHT